VDLDLVLKGRGVRITEHVRRAAEHKLARIQRLRVRRLEVEIIGERNPRIDGRHRVEIAADTTNRVFRARGSGHDVDSALDQVVDRLERQISDYRGKMRGRRQGPPPPPNPSLG
jgi:ribosomal subunit interface protein